MWSLKHISKCLGYIVLAFGAGIVITYFLPACVLAIIEAAILIAAGILYLTNTRK